MVSKAARAVFSQPSTTRIEMKPIEDADIESSWAEHFPKCVESQGQVESPGSDFYVSTFFVIENIRWRFINNVPDIIPTRNRRSRSIEIE